MYSITQMARKAALSRRTVQYWHDKSALQPLNRNPVVYSDDELVLCRILAAFSQSKPAISEILELARIVRLSMVQDASVPADVARTFEMAKHGSEAYFGIAFELDSYDENSWPWTFGAGNAQELTASVLKSLQWKPGLGVTVINLTYCFDLSLTVGSIKDI